MANTGTLNETFGDFVVAGIGRATAAGRLTETFSNFTLVAAGTAQRNLAASTGGAAFLPAPISAAPPASLQQAASLPWVRGIVTVVNSIRSGKVNAVLPVTLVPSASATAVIDARIGPFSALLFSPLTPHAAAEVPTLYVASQTAGSAMLGHTNSALADRAFNMAIVG
jgi:hypothetical protein